MVKAREAIAPTVAGKPMTNEELIAAEKRLEGKRSPLHEDDHPLPKGRLLKTDDGREITQIGKFQLPGVMGHESTLKRFARIEPDFDGWIKMTNQEALYYQDLCLLIGHDGDKKLGLIDHRKLEKIKKRAKEGFLSDKEMEALQQLEGDQ